MKAKNKTIVLALDASIAPAVQATKKHVAIALGLTADHDGELKTLMIQDPDLLKVSALPFTREATMASRELLNTDDFSMARTIARSVQLLQDMVHEHASSKNIPSSFKNVVGKHSSVCMELSSADIFVTAPPAHFGSTGKSKYWARPGNKVSSSVRFALLYEGGKTGKAALELAVARASKVGALLLLLLDSQTSELEKESFRSLYTGLEMRVWDKDASVERLLKLLKLEQIDVLFCQQGDGILKEADSFQRLLEKTPATLVFVPSVGESNDRLGVVGTE